MSLNPADYIRSELLVLIPVLYTLAMFWRAKTNVSLLTVYLTIGAAGVLLSTIWVFATIPSYSLQEVLMAVFVGITQGILCAGAAVYAREMYREIKGSGGNNVAIPDPAAEPRDRQRGV